MTRRYAHDTIAAPKRIQLSRRKGSSLQEASRALNGLPAVKVDRSTKWGNPLAVRSYRGDDGVIVRIEGHWEKGGTLYTNVANEKVGVRTAVALFELLVLPTLDLTPLRGVNIACWCSIPAPGEPDICHGAPILREANRP